MVTYHPKFSRVAATHHRIASSLMPLDSIDRLVNLIEALAWYVSLLFFFFLLATMKLTTIV